jgi:hypothetical protein
MVINSFIFLLWSTLIVYVSKRRLMIGQPLLNHRLELLWSSASIFLLVLDLHILVAKSWC